MKPLAQKRDNNMCKSVIPTVENQLLYSHMSNHYRRIYNAKCSVDTSPSRSSKPKLCKKRQLSINIQPDQICHTDCRLGLVDNQSPSSYTQQSYLGHSSCTDDEVSSQNKGTCSTRKKYCCLQDQKSRTLNYFPKNKNSITRKGSQDVYSRHVQCFTNSDCPFKPRILKTVAQSKLRELKSYHPPSRRKSQLSNSKITQEPEEEALSSGLLDLCEGQNPSSSKESSRDSAYNGGISSGAETPEQHGSETISPDVCHGLLISETLSAESSKQMTLNKREEAAYVKFIYNITEDVLARRIFSNRGLKQLFERHIASNEDRLNMDRMRDEVAKLCSTLDIPDSDGEQQYANGDEGEQLSMNMCNKCTACMNKKTLFSNLKKKRSVDCQTSNIVVKQLNFKPRKKSMAYARSNILRAAENIINKKEYNFSSLSRIKDTVQAAAHLVSSVLDDATIFLNRLAESVTSFRI